MARCTRYLTLWQFVSFSVTSGRSVVFSGYKFVPWENYRPAASHWQTCTLRKPQTCRKPLTNLYPEKTTDLPQVTEKLVPSKSRKQSVKLRAAKKKYVGLLKFANVLSSNPAHGEMYSIFNIMTVCKFFSDFRQVCGFLRVQVCQWLARGRWFSRGPPVSSTNKTDRYGITEILLKVALHIITLWQYGIWIVT
jgi:hypothetical protein